MFNSYEAFKEYEVQASSVEDFLTRYTKRGLDMGRGAEHGQARIESHTADLDKYGYTFITHHDSVTGEIVSYYGGGQRETSQRV